MADLEWLRDILVRTPILAVDLGKAALEGDTAALRYHGAVLAWQQEAALALAETDPGRVKSQSVGGSGPVVDSPSELVLDFDFPVGPPH